VSSQVNERKNWIGKAESLNHTKCACKYNVVFIPKGRRKLLYAELRQHMGEVFHTPAQHKESRIKEGHMMVDHVHMMNSICGISGGGLHQWGKCHSFGTYVWPRESATSWTSTYLREGILYRQWGEVSR